MEAMHISSGILYANNQKSVSDLLVEEFGKGLKESDCGA